MSIVIDTLDPFPALDVQPLSGLSFPWAEFISKASATSDLSFGADGVNLGMNMLIYYEDLQAAAQELLGFSWRDTSSGEPVLRRELPYTNPQWPNLWCTRIASARPLQFIGVTDEGLGPFSNYNAAILTLKFSRPVYPILPDEAIDDSPYGSFPPEEYTRFCDQVWTPSIQMLSRVGGTFIFDEGVAINNKFEGNVGQKLSKNGLARRWYAIPQAGVYNTNGSPSGFLPYLGTVNLYPLFGQAAGTMLLQAIQIIPQPLPLPSYLMNLGNNPETSFSQLQLDLVFHWEYFSPPRGTNTNNTNIPGHNWYPYSGDGLWYPVRFGNTATATPIYRPFVSMDHNELFQID